jgi:hypothetical protein
MAARLVSAVVLQIPPTQRCKQVRMMSGSPTKCHHQDQRRNREGLEVPRHTNEQKTSTFQYSVREMPFILEVSYNYRLQERAYQGKTVRQTIPVSGAAKLELLPPGWIDIGYLHRYVGCSNSRSIHNRSFPMSRDSLAKQELPWQRMTIRP